MFRKAICAFCGCLIYIGISAQTQQIDQVLQFIASNNEELEALRVLMESRRADLATKNRLPDLNAGAYFLPFGVHTGGNYSEYQITQTVEFPTVYATRKRLINQQESMLEITFQKRKQAILAQAMHYYVQLVYYTEKVNLSAQRVSDAQKVLSQVEAMYQKKEVSILVYNKAKIAWLKEQYRVKELETEMSNIENLLIQLNGGKSIEIDFAQFDINFQLPPFDTLWANKVKNDPGFVSLAQQTLIAEQEIKVVKQQNLPKITAGFNSQGIPGERFSGVYAGVSIPLWNNRKKVQRAQYNLDFQQSFQNAEINKSKAEFKKKYDAYSTKLDKYNDYEQTLEGLNSSELLLEAYELGEMSFTEYYGELQFYREAHDTMLKMRLDLLEMKTDILKHQLQ